MKTVSIIGFGRFGKTLYRLLKDDFQLLIFDKGNLDTDSIKLNSKTSITTSLKKVYKSDFIFFAVPISQFEKVIKEHRNYFNPRNTLIDVLSVKIHPKKIFLKTVKDMNIGILLTHPMFGPDSSKNGFDGLPIVLDKFRTGNEIYAFWKAYFTKKGLSVIEMTADEHDRLAADSQGLTHFVGRLLEKVRFKKTPIDSVGSKKLNEVMEQTINDTWQLFTDLQTYNPYTKKMRLKLGNAYSQLYNKLLPVKADSRYITYGIQGGKGSFNEEAILYYIHTKKIKKYKIKYLFTSEKVFKNLHEGQIDYGIFAITNARGGMVEESMQALAKYSSVIVADFQILIRHFLMKRKDVPLDMITTIMAHPQVFAQCKETLKNKYPRYKLISGNDDYIDTAKAAEKLAAGTMSENIAILGPINLAQRYNFDIIAENLQDNKNNYTRFLLVKR